VPFTTEIPGRLRELDMGAVDRILASDRNGFTEYVRRTGATICGRNAIEVLLSVLPHPIESSLLDYDTSGNITGEWDHSVSYASLSFHTGS
jgi:AmmeMemoRadiSam system protein B